MRVGFICNPTSGGGRTERILPQLQRVLAQFFATHGIDHDIAFTRYGGHASKLARQAANAGLDIVVPIGGDGTLNEVVNGLMQARDAAEGASDFAMPKLGLLPQGTGGDFRRSVATAHKLEAYLESLLEGEGQAIDVGRASFSDHKGETKTHYFVNILSAGLGGLVDQEVAKLGSGQRNGTTTYLKAAAKALRRSALARLRCTFVPATDHPASPSIQRSVGQARTQDAAPTDETSIMLSSRNIAICNGRYFGGGMQVAPMARLNDGLFDVVNFSAAKRLQLLKIGQMLYKGKHLSLPQVQFFRTRKLTLELMNPGEAAKDFLLDVDGEALGRMPLTIEAVPGALCLLGV